ncbi:MAG: hypothetical protein KatS3mg101_0097 [Patescibacteria group bacterium]|nr:MAG: hypothetical protein KatS3mg101_0097 [Patescibacteria group bacterium]
MKNTKILFIRLYIGTLYSNFIVPLRGSNYTQLLYGDLKKRLGFFFGQIRWLAWQEHTNGLVQISSRIRATFEADELDQNLTETWLGTLLQLFSNTSSKIASDVIRISLVYHQKITTKIPLKYHQKLGHINKVCKQNQRKEYQYNLSSLDIT